MICSIISHYIEERCEQAISIPEGWIFSWDRIVPAERD